MLMSSEREITFIIWQKAFIFSAASFPPPPLSVTTVPVWWRIESVFTMAANC